MTNLHALTRPQWPLAGFVKGERRCGSFVSPTESSAESVSWHDARAQALRAETVDRVAGVHIEPGVFGLGNPNLLRCASPCTSCEATMDITVRPERNRVEPGTLLERGKTVYHVRDNGAGFGTRYAGK